MGQVFEVIKPTIARGRQTKFTPETIRQITNLVERGKSRDEIAEILGVTTGTLQVTCSKLGVSLRRPNFGIGATSLYRPRAQPKGNYASVQPVGEPGASASSKKDATPPVPIHLATCESPRPVANFSIQVCFKGKEWKTPLELGPEIVSQLALEAESRGLKVGELLSETIAAVAKCDLFETVLDRGSGRR